MNLRSKNRSKSKSKTLNKRNSSYKKITSASKYRKHKKKLGIKIKTSLKSKLSINKHKTNKLKLKVKKVGGGPNNNMPSEESVRTRRLKNAIRNLEITAKNTKKVSNQLQKQKESQKELNNNINEFQKRLSEGNVNNENNLTLAEEARKLELGDDKNKLIKIDDTYFYLGEYNPKTYYNRGLLDIQSIIVENGEEKRFNFFVYRSHSELGFWRFAYHDTRKLWKGNPFRSDYIQTTFIDLRLQKFINRLLNQLPITDEATCKLEDYLDINDYYVLNEKGEYQYDDDGILKHNGKIFKILDAIDSRNKTNLNSMFINQEKFDKYSRCGSGPEKEHIYNCAKILEDNYNIGNIDIIDDNYVFKVNVGMGGTLDVTDSKIYSVILNKKPKPEPEPKPESVEGAQKENSEPDTDPELIKLLPNNLKMYYIHVLELNVESKGEENRSFKDYKIPIFLEILDDGSKILNTGVYKDYFTLGGYICKTLEYDEQCSQKNSQNCTLQYRFMGDLYKYGAKDGGPVFPFNII
jgi:hypothetical protein